MYVRDVDLSELAHLMSGGMEQEGYLDPATGRLYIGFDGEVLGDDEEPADPDEQGWIRVGVTDARTEYRDMEAFAYAVGDPRVRHRLLEALEGRGAFRRFRNVVYNQPDELGKVWNRYRDAVRELRAVDFLVDEGILAEEATADVRAQRARAAEEALSEAAGGGGRARLVLLNGLPGVGKSAVAQAYVAERPGVLNLDIDVLRSLLGGPYAATAELGRTLGLSVATAHLLAGHDVVVPQLVADPHEVGRFQGAAEEAGATFVQVVLTGSTASPGEAPPWRADLSEDELEAYAAGLDAVIASSAPLVLANGRSAEATAEMLAGLLAGLLAQR